MALTLEPRNQDFENDTYDLASGPDPRGRHEGVAYVEPWDYFKCRVVNRKVVLLVDGRVERGHIRLAAAMVAAALASNPYMIEYLLSRWISENKASDDSERRWREGYEDELALSPALSLARDDESREDLYRRADLTDRQARAMRLYYTAGHESLRVIARRLVIDESTLREHLEAAKNKLRKLAIPPQPVRLDLRAIA